jgi:hypothetical protein
VPFRESQKTKERGLKYIEQCTVGQELAQLTEFGILVVVLGVLQQ